LKSENKVNNKVIVYICYKVYLINNLKTKFFKSVNILKLKQVIINILSRKLKFEFYKKNLILCEIKIRNNVRICQIICTTKKKIILAKLTTKIVISLKKKNKFFECNFFLELTMLETYIYFVNANF
jgi:hypothetical protein